MPLKPPMLPLAREAIARRETADDYGSPRECVLLMGQIARAHTLISAREEVTQEIRARSDPLQRVKPSRALIRVCARAIRSEEQTSELQSQSNLVCRLLLEKTKYMRR